MKRYTGQKALYEAISRSRAKAKQHSILEKLRPGSSKPETPGTLEQELVVEPEQTAEPVVEESLDSRAVETPSQPVIESPLQAEPTPEQVSEMPTPMSRAEPDLTPRTVERFAHGAQPSPARKWLRPRPVQLNEGRIEVSVPYYVGVIAGLVLIMVILVAYRLGQARPGGQGNGGGQAAVSAAIRSGSPTNPPTGTAEPSGATSHVDRSSVNPPAVTTTRQDTSPVVSQGDNWIVLTRYETRKDLEPVVEHFGRYGIDLFILPLEQAPALFAEYGLNAAKLPRGSGFLLVTVKAYDNPNVAGSEGNKMLKRIAEVGALYKAPSGLESFATHRFSDAYGMKIR